MKVVQERNIVNAADSSFDLVKQCQIKDIMVKCLTCVSYLTCSLQILFGKLKGLIFSSFCSTSW